MAGVVMEGGGIQAIEHGGHPAIDDGGVVNGRRWREVDEGSSEVCLTTTKMHGEWRWGFTGGGAPTTNRRRRTLGSTSWTSWWRPCFDTVARRGTFPALPGSRRGEDGGPVDGGEERMAASI
jgi:hypothetical protein